MGDGHIAQTGTDPSERAGDPVSPIRGSNQAGMRAHNERLVLSLVRRHGALAKADIARITGLSAQTVSVIMRALEKDGLLERGEPLRGKVGQPLVPIRLAERGAFFLGLKVGRRSVDLILVDFLGRILGRRREVYAFPSPDTTIRFALDSIRDLAASLDPGERQRIGGLGIAIPFRLWDWARALGVPDREMAEWKERDIRCELEKAVDFPVYLENDATSACGAELVFGRGENVRDMIYFYIGYFIGGGVVLNGALFTGRTGNAGALGSMPIPSATAHGQLIDVASLRGLETELQARGIDCAAMWESPVGWSYPADVVAAWVDTAARGLAFAIASATAVLDSEVVLIDGWIPDDVKAALVDATRAELSRLDTSGLVPPAIGPGTIGPDARALGAATLPLSRRFLIETRSGFAGT